MELIINRLAPALAKRPTIPELKDKPRGTIEEALAEIKRRQKI